MGLVLIIWQLDSIYTLLLVNFVSIYSNNVFLYGAQLTIRFSAHVMVPPTQVIVPP